MYYSALELRTTSSQNGESTLNFQLAFVVAINRSHTLLDGRLACNRGVYKNSKKLLFNINCAKCDYGGRLHDEFQAGKRDQDSGGVKKLGEVAELGCI